MLPGIRWCTATERFPRLTVVQPGTAQRLAVPSQNLFPVAAEVFLILPFQRVTGRTEAQREDLIFPARAADGPLYQSRHRLHHPLRSRRVQNLHVHQPAVHEEAGAVVALHRERCFQVVLPAHAVQQFAANHFPFDHRIQTIDQRPASVSSSALLCRRPHLWRGRQIPVDRLSINS